MRIVSLLPSTTEILFALGRGDDVVGVTFECNEPAEALTRRIVSTSALPEGLTPGEIDRIVTERMNAGEDLYRLDAGALADLDPDVVVTQDLCAVCAVDVSEVDDALAHLGCSAEVVTIDPHRLDDVLESIHTLGRLTGAADRAIELVDGLRERLDTLRSRVAGLERPPVLVVEWTDPALSPGHWLPDLVEAAGGECLLGDPGAKSRRVGWDEIAGLSPAAVVMAPCGYDLTGATALAEAALATGHWPAGVPMWAVDADASFVRPGPRLIDGAETLAAILHPDLGPPDPTLAHLVRP
ncbi:MAG: ABC transporter substrate-binding protein [Acidimicrobiales bacterium]